MQKSFKNKKELNAWPYAIVGSIFLVVIACGITIKIALNHPVQLDEGYYLSKYQDVDNSINDLLAKQRIFDETYTVEHNLRKVIMGKSTIIPVSVRLKTDLSLVDKASIELLLTRPDSNDFNLKMQSSTTKDGSYLFGPITVDKPGRWQLLAKVRVGEDEGFIKHEIFATP
ncbi:MAG: 4-hydroxy-3-methylbut-2-en-1-yl diphosphate synthase [Campylobacteraceae bacterium]|nr:4-hydroxy-3-methylbut-2-en-1-yl diphosphate synthase [Campylobacteraceae bacterium]